MKNNNTKLHNAFARASHSLDEALISYNHRKHMDGDDLMGYGIEVKDLESTKLGGLSANDNPQFYFITYLYEKRHAQS